MRDEKLHAGVVRSAFPNFPSQNAQNALCSEQVWHLRYRNCVRRCGAKRISKSKCTKHTNVGALLEVEMSKKCTKLRARSTFGNQTPTRHVRATFGRWSLVSCGRRKGFCTLLKLRNHWKNTVFRDFSTFSPICIFFLLTLSLLWSSLTLPTSAFPSVHIVGRLTSKLPSVIFYIQIYMDMRIHTDLYVMFLNMRLWASTVEEAIQLRDDKLFKRLED